MRVDRSIVGKASEPVTFVVQADHIRTFAEAIGELHPACRSGLVAPPTFAATFVVPLPGLEVDLRRVLHREEEYEFVRPIRAGDRVTVVRRIVDLMEKGVGSARTTVVVSEAEGRDPAGELIFRSRTSVVVR